jgi:Xaa-Pro aminopeptidase
VGDALVWLKTNGSQKPVSLFVDGRYHLQADQEVPLNLVEVVKIDCEPSLQGVWLEHLSAHKGLKIGIDPERVSASTLIALRGLEKSHQHQLVYLKGPEILQALGLSGWTVGRDIVSLATAVTGRTPSGLLTELTAAMREKAGSDRVMHVTCASDDAAFLLNARAYHIPNQASVSAYTFLVKNQLILFLPDASAQSDVKLDQSQFGAFDLKVIKRSIEELSSELKKHQVDQVFYYGNTMNGLIPTMLTSLYPQAQMQDQFKWVTLTRRRKTPQEITTIRSAFLRSSRVISKMLRYGKSETVKAQISEKDLALKLYDFYKDEGAVALSFSTICGAGPNSAIVHYSKPSKDVYFQKGQIALIDSGAYYSEGFCTDCTREFFVGGGSTGIKPEAWLKDIYTTTLKAAIQVFLKPVPSHLHGREVDAMIRGEVKKAGYDYLHGTGHGVGIHVHEEGIRFSTQSDYEQSPYACVSVEPGIYLEGKGGVRIENVVILMPEGSTHYRYENLVFVGYDWDLIDLDRLTDDEKKYLKHYESQCRELGTQLMECPL